MKSIFPNILQVGKRDFCKMYLARYIKIVYNGNVILFRETAGNRFPG